MERLNKFLAHAGIGSRRHCEDLIRSGRVSVDGDVVRELGTKVDPDAQEISVNRKRVQPEHLTYWLVNKPIGYLCTNHDPAGRPLAIDLVPHHVKQRVYPVGRLDEQSDGLLLLTNDGELANRLMHPRYGVEKTYLVQVAGSPRREDLQKLLDGIWLSEGRVKAKHVKRLRKQGDSSWLQIVLNEGKNREIRRMLAKLEHKVLRLKRIAIGPIRIGHLSKGKARPLRREEVESLKRVSGLSATPDSTPTQPKGKPVAGKKPTSRKHGSAPAALPERARRKSRPQGKESGSTSSRSNKTRERRRR